MHAATREPVRPAPTQTPHAKCKKLFRGVAFSIRHVLSHPKCAGARRRHVSSWSAGTRTRSRRTACSGTMSKQQFTVVRRICNQCHMCAVAVCARVMSIYVMADPLIGAYEPSLTFRADLEASTPPPADADSPAHDADRSCQVGSSATIPPSFLVHLGRQCQQRDLRLFPAYVNPSFEVTGVKSKIPSTSKPGHTSSQNSLNALSKQQSENTRDRKNHNSEVG